jgi:elongation factor G
MVEKVVEQDEKAMNKFLAGEELTEAELKPLIRKGTCSFEFVPVICGSALKNKGVQFLLDAIVDYLPSPVDIGKVVGTNPDNHDEILERKLDDSDPFTAIAFKIAADPFVGKLCFFRVYAGILKSGSYVLNTTTGERERIGRIVRMHANAREDVDEVYSGDIAAAVGLKNTFTGHTLCDENHPILLEKFTFPEPVIHLAIEPKTKVDQEKMGIALAKLAEEDPTFRVRTDEETMQTIIAGMGELHLDIIVDRMRREFKVECNVGQPQVAYKERLKKAAEGEGKYIKQTGGRGQYGHCYVRVEPGEVGSGYVFEDETKGGSIPKEFIKPIEKGAGEALERGILAGYPVIDTKVTVTDGSYHDVDSSEMAFKIAGSMAVQDAAKHAGIAILEPIMKVEVITPENFMGEVIGDLNSKRAMIKEMRDRTGMKLIDADVPLSEMFGYATALRSMTQGRASYSMEFGHYAEVPKNVETQIVEGKRK